MSVPIKTPKIKRANVHEQVVDYRNRDKSCKNISNPDSIYYQCFTCDKSKVFYICGECKRNGNHVEHELIEKEEAEAVRHCDCGGSPGVYSCKNHIKCELMPYNIPILCKLRYFKDICEKFELNADKCIELCRLNQIRKVKRKSAEGIIIQNYFDNTNAHKMEICIKQCWSVYRKGQEYNFIEKGFDKTRRMLLWHGTKKENLYGILSNGFRKPEGDRVKNGSMFGRGIYFADRMSKSAQYCDKNGFAILFLCEVALGDMWRICLPKDYEEVPERFHSIKGLGRKIPERDGDTNLAGILVPSGKTVDNPHPITVSITHLKYNEYIVFDPERVLIKYIIAFKLKAESCNIS